MKILLLAGLVVLISGCASWNLHTACFNVTGNNLVTPYGPASGNARFCTETCIGTGCPKADTAAVEALTNAMLTAETKPLATVPMTSTITQVK